VLLYTGFIFYISSMPTPFPNVKVDLSILHVPMFFMLSYLVARAVSASTGSGKRTTIAAAIAFTVAYGVFDELHQLYVPGRTFSCLDIGFDALGGGLIVFKPWWEKLFERVDL
jgi:VanZ family protein